MHVVIGRYYFGNKRVAVRNDLCTVCNQPCLAEGRRSLVVLHVFFIPLLPAALVTRWYCTRCGNQTDAHRPSRRPILLLGVAFGVIIVSAGPSQLEKNDLVGAIACFVLGAAAMIGFAWMIKQQKDKAYLKAKSAIVPLKGDHCPCCNGELLPSPKPRCHSCQIRIITKIPSFSS